MKKVGIWSKTLNLLRKIKSIPLRYKIFATFALLFIIIGILLTFYIINNYKITSTKKEVVKPSKTSKISLSTDTLYIKEWNVQAPVNGNVLGKVSYSLSDNNKKIHFNSTKLDNIDLSSMRCRELNITKNSWGLSRNSKKSSYEPNKRPMIIGNYEYYRNFPISICSNVKEIDAAFNYLYIHLGEV